MEYMTNIMEIVRTYDGTEAYRKDCRYIRGNYYIKDVQCFNINDTWYRINSDKIAFDNETKSWIVVDYTTRLINGIIAIENNIPVFGKFSPNLLLNSDVYYEGNVYTVIRESILKNCSMVLEGVNGRYYFNTGTIPKQYTRKLKPQRDGYYSFPFNYGSESLIPLFTRQFLEDFKPNPLSSDAWKYINKFTFGVEFETELGAIPEKYLVGNGLIPCRDGSISGFEYATIPLKGESGIQCIKKCCELLQKYCSCSPNESLHIHIGGYPRTIKGIAALYRLGLLIQKEIYAMFPYYYTNTANFKRKGYCNPLYQVGEDSKVAREIFEGIYNYLSGGVGKFTRFPTGTHPLDRSGQHKWEISPRYHWLNLIPLIWGNRGTIEFRCHTPTLQAQKVINWLFIVVAIMQYALEHANTLVGTIQSELPKIALKDIISSVYPKNISTILNSYITARKVHYHSKNDIVGEVEIFSELYSEIFKLEKFV